MAKTSRNALKVNSASRNSDPPSMQSTVGRLATMIAPGGAEVEIRGEVDGDGPGFPTRRWLLSRRI
jgi:hypothetical protein